MSYCQSCGARLEPGARFCTVCGSAVSQAESGAREKKSASGKKFPVWIAAVVAVVAALAVGFYYLFSSGALKSAPEQFVAIQSEKYIEPVLNSVAMSLSGESVEKAKNDFVLDTDVTIRGNGSFDGAISEILDESEITLKLKTGEESGGLFGFSLNLMGSDVLSGTFVVEDNSIGISLPELLDEYYVVHTEDIPGILKALDIDLPLDVEASASALAGALAGSSLDGDLVKSVLEKYVQIFFSMVTDENTEKSRGTVELKGLGESEKCTVITFRPEKDDISEMLTVLVETLVNDKDARSLFQQAIKAAGMDADEEMEGYDAFMDELRIGYKEDIEDISAEVSEADLAWSVAFKKDRIYQIAIRSESRDEGVAYESWGKAVSGRTDAIVWYDGSEAERAVSNEVRLDGKTISGILEANEDLLYKEASAKYSFDTLNRSGLKVPYGDLEADVDGVKVNISVGEGKNGSSHRVNVDFNGEEYGVEIVSSDKASTVEKPQQAGIAVTGSNVQDILSGLVGQVLTLAFQLLY